MKDDRGDIVVSSAIGEWRSSLEAVLFGTTDSAEIVDLVNAFCERALGVGIDRVTFYKRGVGAVFGVSLADGRRAVIKVHRADLTDAGLDGIRAVQRRLAERGLPVPRPLGAPRALGNGIAAAEEMLESAGTSDGHTERGRQALVAGLRTFVEAATPMLESVRLPSAPPYNLPRTQLWPTPHDLRFDLTLAGGEWIDERAEVARSTLERVGGAMVVGHADWRVENVRLDRTEIVAIFDWDSVCIAPEAALVGANSADFTSDWGDPAVDPYPSHDEMSAFVREYETARGHPFTSEEREVAEAARLYRLAYIARCEHSDTVLDLIPSDPDHSSTALLRSMT
jgi:Ser/Thr protein kinase RdoA (MazF antagonist)